MKYLRIPKKDKCILVKSNEKMYAILRTVYFRPGKRRRTAQIIIDSKCQ